MDQTVKREVSDASLIHAIERISAGFQMIPDSAAVAAKRGFKTSWSKQPLSAQSVRMFMEIITVGLAERGGSFIHDRMRFRVVDGHLTRSMV